MARSTKSRTPTEEVADATEAVGKAAARVADAAAKKSSGRIEVRVPGAFNGERNGVVFENGVGYVCDDSPGRMRAHACLEIEGCTVTKDGEPLWPI